MISCNIANYIVAINRSAKPIHTYTGRGRDYSGQYQAPRALAATR